MRCSAAWPLTALSLAGCLSSADDCSAQQGRSALTVRSGAFRACPIVSRDAYSVDYTPPPNPGAMHIDRDAGQVTFTRTLDGSVVISRYRIVRR